jgi:hypothetical protein
MDTLLTAVRQLMPGSPALFLATVVLLLLCGAAGKRLFGSVQRQGARIGRLEQLHVQAVGRARLERVRRYQLEVALLREGVDLAPWPDSPTADDVDQDDDDPDDDRRPADPTSELATQHFSRNRLRRSS